MSYLKKPKEVKAVVKDPPCRQSNRVIVRIWTSERNKEFPGAAVGHVAIETSKPAGYMSLWPKMEPEDMQAAKKSSGFFIKVPHEFKQNVKEDEKAEGRAPEITLCLYSLDSELLFDAWQTKKTTVKGWVLIGHNRLINQGSADSCSGLAYQLLTAGGIYKLISKTRFSSTFSSVVTPDDLGQAVYAAKQQELVLYPETAGFDYPGETEVAPLKDSSWCVIS